MIAAEMALLAAQQELDGLSDDLSLTEAETFQTIVEINREIGDIQYRLYNLNIPSAYANMEIVEALELAKGRLNQARQDFEPYKYKSSGDPTRRTLGEEVERTRSDFNSILRRLENEAALKDAEARLIKAEADYQASQVGPDPDAVAIAEARIKNAEAQLKVARSALKGINLVAPISGLAVAVNIIPGDTVLPGQVVVTLAELSNLRVETTDLSERDVAEVEIGQTATVYVEALDQELPGRVVRIAPQAVIVGGDVTYTAVVELDELPAGLRWGMTVEVDITQD
ncbi:efflux RND transporter periplasmic adaptor subunit [Chloroflexota bacterium]